MKNNKQYDVIIIGGSYSGLAAAMALGRALIRVLIIDSGKPCNAQTPYSHNFLTQDGKTPKEISSLAKHQVQAYNSIKFFDGMATYGTRTEAGFEILVATGETFYASKLIFASGILDILPSVTGFSDCWGISILHCPYCHGYEVRNEKTGIFGNGEYGFELARLISNWTDDLTLYTNGKAILTNDQKNKLKGHDIKIEEREITSFEHDNGYVQNVIFRNGSKSPVSAIYVRNSFKQHSNIPESLGCELTAEGYLRVNHLQETTINDIYACGDNAAKMRSVANSVAMGTTAGMMASKKMVAERF